MQKELDPIEFTNRSEKVLYDIVDLAEFKHQDVETILDALLSSIRLIPFSDYLKRYIFKKASMTGVYDEIPLSEYQYIIIDSFAENGTPKSLNESTTKLSALAKNLLTQGTVNRSAVFLLGFGLNMSVDDVSGFLTKALHERDFNFKNPAEIIYWYCFRKGYKFYKMKELKRIYEEELKPGEDLVVSLDKTSNIRAALHHIDDDEMLLYYLSSFKKSTDSCQFSVTIWQCFSELFKKCTALIVEHYNMEEHKKTAEDITAADVEKLLCSGTPFNKNGNLEKLSSSKLGKHFAARRFSRQHITKILERKTQVDRFDLITLNFFLFAHNENYPDNKKRSYAFIEDTNIILKDCMMGEYYLANPYECFLLMCILTDSPLDAYVDVWELSYDGKI